MFRKIIKTDDRKTTLIIRLMVGAVFFSEGIQKFLYPLINGAGRFEKIGLPWPEFFGPFAGSLRLSAEASLLTVTLGKGLSLRTLYLC